MHMSIWKKVKVFLASDLTIEPLEKGLKTGEYSHSRKLNCCTLEPLLIWGKILRLGQGQNYAHIHIHTHAIIYIVCILALNVIWW